ncbi:protein translocase subunit SecD [Euzebya tangerina]|uniref:protein translocase subunit SecD n=1 Tax=Euzebya tangerina TaxID=591198 RepID=UPI000E31C9CE|nr:protein translocase subunit SecD [Euzebya tangerina]
MSQGRLTTLIVVFLVTLGGLWGYIVAADLSPRLGLDLQGGVSANLLPAEGQGEIDEEILDQTVATIRERVDALGVAEPDIARQGDTIQVQLPGVADQEQAREIIGRTAQLQFRQVVEELPPDPGLLSDTASELAGATCDERSDLSIPDPDEEVVLCLRGTDADGNDLPRDQWFRLRLGPVEVSGADLTDAQAVLQPQTLGEVWQTNLEFNSEGAAAFAEITGNLACLQGPQRQLAIVLDNIVEQAPPVAQDVACGVGIGGGTAVVQATSEDDARDLAIVLKAGALPIQLDFGTFQTISPTLGRDSLDAGLLAGLIGLVLVAVYLVLLYRGMGAAAVLELILFGATVFGLIIALGEWIGFTLTLAGIAGVIVSIGIAADSSIIYRERYRDEVRAGRTIRTAADHAFDKAFRTNLTGNTVSFLAAVVLYLLAVGPVRGFAFTLGLSTLVDTLLFATFTRGLFGLVARNPKLVDAPLMGLRSGVTSEQLAAATAGGRRRRKGGRKKGRK